MFLCTTSHIHMQIDHTCIIMGILYIGHLHISLPPETNRWTAGTMFLQASVGGGRVVHWSLNLFLHYQTATSPAFRDFSALLAVIYSSSVYKLFLSSILFKVSFCFFSSILLAHGSMKVFEDDEVKCLIFFAVFLPGPSALSCVPLDNTWGEKRLWKYKNNHIWKRFHFAPLLLNKFKQLLTAQENFEKCSF